MRPALSRATPCAIVAACLFSASCTDLLGIEPGQARAEAGTEPGAGDGCRDARRRLLLWTLGLGQLDYVTLKNPSECAIDLENIVVVFDDRDDAFQPALQIDCAVRLPPVVLAPGASVRVHEYPQTGDIDALAGKIGPCEGDLSFNPERGGATYLCDGECSPDTLIDVVAHRGYFTAYGDPPPYQFGATFVEALGGITSAAEAEELRLQRVAGNGRRPQFLGSDWTLERRSLFADFEDGLTLRISAQPAVPWDTVPGQATEIAASAEAALFNTLGLSLTHAGPDGISTALSYSLSGIGSPRAVSYFARLRARPSAAGYVDLLWRGNRVIETSFEASGLGAEIENGVRFETPYTVDQWHQVELRDIDWPNRKFDLYVDRRPIALGVGFWYFASALDEIRIYSVSGGSIVHFDALEFWE
jgi:hypothetical protein